jgi:hypothetical protein
MKCFLQDETRKEFEEDFVGGWNFVCWKRQEEKSLLLKSKLLVFFFVVGIKILNSPWEESCRNSQILGVSSKKTSVCKKWVKLRRASSTRI